MEMETFSVEKSLYDIDSGSDLRYLWDSDIEQQDVFRAVGDTDMHDWGPGLLDVKPHVILHDRLISDAALGKLPVKTEHSYSLSSSDGDSIPDSPLSVDNSMDDLESECYPCMTMKCRDSYSPITVKEEPLSEPASPQSVTSCYPMSPCSSPPLLHAEIYQNTAPQKWLQQTQQQQSILKQQQQQPTFLVTTRANLFNTPNRIVFPKLNIKVEPISSGFPLPPTPPSSTTSDSESNLSPDHEASPLHHRSPGATTTSPRLFLSTNRQPIQTPLISTQQKGSTGMLILTEEEKRTLLAEGYPIPTRLPLTKTEEKSLKKIRRKIKNKISAQESRRKKKEYMDALEKKVEILVMENDDFKNKIESLEDKNAGLLNQLRTLQALVTRGSLSGRHTDTPVINSTFFNESSTDK